MRISVVVPCMNEEGNIAPLAEEIGSVLEGLGDYEIIFVDDGSSDGSLGIAKSLNAMDPRIRYIGFSRNFGHQAALRAGMEEAKGDCVITMDADFQHPPSLIPRLIEAYRSGKDIVLTRRLDPPKGSPGRPSLFKRLTSRVFYASLNAMSDIKINPGSADFRLLSRKAADALLSMRESELFLRGAVPWIGFDTAEIPFLPDKRRSGNTKYSIRKMAAFALSGITSFSVKPLRLTSLAGAVISGAGFVYAIYALAMRAFTSRTVEGWTSLLISVLIIGGMQLLSIGIVGEYLGKLFMESKGRPHFIVKEESPSPWDRGGPDV